MKKVLLFVHGAGNFDSDYAADPLAQVALRMDGEPLAVPVYYADICNVGAPPQVTALDAAGAPPQPPLPEPPEVHQFKLAFAMQVQANISAQPQTEKGTFSTMSISFLAQLVATEVNEIAGYLFNSDIYNQICARMCAGLDAAARQGDTLVIASHSLGTLVAFDALKAVGDRYHVSTFFTLGCPLAILRRLGCRDSDLGVITTQHVGQWLNFYDTADPISSVVGPYFPRVGFRPYDVFVDVAPTMPAAHDYFGNGEVLDALANAMR